MKMYTYPLSYALHVFFFENLFNLMLCGMITYILNYIQPNCKYMEFCSSGCEERLTKSFKIHTKNITRYICMPIYVAYLR